MNQHVKAEMPTKITVIFEHGNGSSETAIIPRALWPEWSTEWEEPDFYSDTKIVRPPLIKSMTLRFRPLPDPETGVFGEVTHTRPDASVDNAPASGV